MFGQVVVIYLPLQLMEDDENINVFDHVAVVFIYPCSTWKTMGRKRNVLTTCLLFYLPLKHMKDDGKEKECFGHVVIVFIYPCSKWKTKERRKDCFDHVVAAVFIYPCST
jgi:hypothetical protein